MQIPRNWPMEMKGHFQLTGNSQWRCLSHLCRSPKLKVPKGFSNRSFRSLSFPLTMMTLFHLKRCQLFKMNGLLETMAFPSREQVVRTGVGEKDFDIRTPRILKIQIRNPTRVTCLEMWPSTVFVKSFAFAWTQGTSKYLGHEENTVYTKKVEHAQLAYTKVCSKMQLRNISPFQRQFHRKKLRN